MHQNLLEFHEAHCREMPRSGLAEASVSFALVVDADGKLLRIQDLRMAKEGEKKKTIPAKVMLPICPNATSGYGSGVGWGTVEQVFGVPGKSSSGKPRKRERASGNHATFVHGVTSGINGAATEAAKSMAGFVDSKRLQLNLKKARRSKAWAELVQVKNRMVLVNEEGEPLCTADDIVAEAACDYYMSQQSPQGPSQTCTECGETGPVLRVHPRVKPLRGMETKSPLLSANNVTTAFFGKDARNGLGVCVACGMDIAAAWDMMRASEDHSLDLTNWALLWHSTGGSIDELLQACLRGAAETPALDIPVDDDEQVYVDGYLASTGQRISSYLRVWDRSVRLLPKLRSWVEDIGATDKVPSMPQLVACFCPEMSLSTMADGERRSIEYQLVLSILYGDGLPGYLEDTLSTLILREMDVKKGTIPRWRAALLSMSYNRNSKRLGMNPVVRAPDITEEELAEMPPAAIFGLWVGNVRTANRAAIPEKVGVVDTVASMVEGFTVSPAMMFNELHGRFVGYLQTMSRGGKNAAFKNWLERRSESLLAAINPNDMKAYWTPVERTQFLLGYNRALNLRRFKKEDEKYEEEKEESDDDSN